MKQKLASRKFWAGVAGVVTSICVLIGADGETTVKIVGLIGAVGSVVVYMLAEAHVDANREPEIKLGGSEKDI